MGPATMIATGDGGIAGHITSLGHEPHHFTHFYVLVDDLQAALDKANALGGKTVVPPVEIPTGAFAWFADPDGNTVGLFRASSKSPCRIVRRTSPQSPAQNLCSWKRCVITGMMSRPDCSSTLILYQVSYISRP
jgi:uncharacterized protein